MISNVLNNIWTSLWKQHSKTKEILKFAHYNKQEKYHKAESSLDNDTTKHPNNLKDPNVKPTYTKAKIIGLILGPLLFLLILLLFQPEGLNFEGRVTLAITIWIATWWVTEAIPIPATALLPILLFPIFGAVEADQVFSAYGDNIIFLFLGGFLIARAMEKWNLHLRIALFIINLVGVSMNRLVLGFMIATSFLSLWISNTASSMLMIPIGMAIISQAGESFKNDPTKLTELKKFEKSIVFGIGYAATIAGSGTLISGTANPIFAAQASELFDITITFGQFMAFGIPFVAVFIMIAWAYITQVKYRMKVKNLPGGAEIIKAEREKLGSMSMEEKVVLFVFATAAFFWITRSFIWSELLVEVSDGMIAMLAALLLFSIPSSNRRERILEWNDTQEIPWGILVLFGGGLAIAAAFTSTGLAEWTGDQFALLEGVNFVLIILVITIVILLMTEITSITATATLLMPIVATLGVALNINPIVLMVACALATNGAFMLPVATPPNAIMFGTQKISILDMVKVGGVLNIIAIVLIVIAIIFYLPFVWGIELRSF